MANECLCLYNCRNALLFHGHDFWWLNFASDTCAYTKGCAKAARILWLKIEFACYYCLKCHKNQACSIILAWVNYKVAKNCLKVGKITILCSNFGQIWKSATLQVVAHQNLVKWSLVYLKSFSKKSDPARPRKDFGLVAFDTAFWPWFFWSETFFHIIYDMVVPY